MLAPVIRKLETLGAFAPEDRRLLERVQEDVRSFPARRDIIREGDTPQHMRVILKGWAARYNVVADGGRQITTFLMPGDICQANPRLITRMDHSITALSAVEIAMVPSELIEEMLARPAIADALRWADLVDGAIARIWLVSMGKRDAFSRVAHLFCELEARLRRVGLTEGDQFDLPMTQEGIGDVLGLTSVHINRTLRRAREEGLVTFVREIVTIHDLNALWRAAGFDPTYLHLDGN